MATEKFVTESSLSPQTAFALMIDLERVPEWDKGISESRLVHGEPASIGARYELTLTGFDGNPTKAVYELTAVDDDRAFTMVGTNPTFRAEDTLSFQPAGDGCLVTYDAGLTLLDEAPPINELQLSKIFAKIVAVAEDGVSSFLNP